VALEQAVNGAQGRQRRVLLLPLPIEHLDGNGRMGFDLGHDQPFLLGCELAGHAAIAAALRMQGRKPAVLVSIPPVFKRAHRQGTA